LDQVVGHLGALDFAGAEDSDIRQWAADHGDFVAGIEARAGLAVLVDFVGHGVAFCFAKAIVLEKCGDAGEEADAHDAVVFGFVDEVLEDTAAGAEAFGLGLHDDGTNFGEVWAVEMERAATEEVRIGLAIFREFFGDGEVADVLAELRVGAAEEGAIAGERIDEVEDVAGILDAGLANVDGGIKHRRLLWRCEM